MFESGGLAVSLPAKEIEKASLPGSLFQKADLDGAPLSEELRIAIDLIDEACVECAIPLVLVARPEIFTNDHTLTWLRGKLGGIEDHLAISDGTTARLIPQMRNHIFLYKPGAPECAAAFRQLVRRVPELLTTLSTQVNSAYSFKTDIDSTPIGPPSLLLQPQQSRKIDQGSLTPFYLNRHSLEDSVGKMVSQPPVPYESIGQFTKVTYVPLTLSAIENQPFADMAAGVVARGYLDPTRATILRLPPNDMQGVDLAERLTPIVGMLRYASNSIPRGVASNIFFAWGDLEDAFPKSFPGPIDVVLHDSFDFWRHTGAFYSGLNSIRLAASEGRRRDRLRTQSLLNQAFGGKLALDWLEQSSKDIY